MNEYIWSEIHKCVIFECGIFGTSLSNSVLNKLQFAHGQL